MVIQLTLPPRPALLRRYSYRRLLVTFFFFCLYIVILFMQKEKRTLYKVWESLMSLAPADNSQQSDNPACARPTLRHPASEDARYPLLPARAVATRLRARVSPRHSLADPPGLAPAPAVSGHTRRDAGQRPGRRLRLDPVHHHPCLERPQLRRHQL